MASLKKRGKYYYIKFSRTINGKTEEVVRSLRISKKPKAKEALETLEEMEERNEIDPFAEYFDPVSCIEDQKKDHIKVEVYTVREAVDYFFKLKSHLSNGTVGNYKKKKRANKKGAYERAIGHFVRYNDIADLSIKKLGLHHFENVIFKPNIKSATRHFYYRQLRVFWNTLRDRHIVSSDFFKTIKKNLPPKKANTRPKMITESELQDLFKAYEKEVERKKKLPEYRPYFSQQWFKPLICCYFYGGLRRNEAGYNPDLPYSGLQGKNLYYEDDELLAIYLEATKGRNERFIPINSTWRKHLQEYIEVRGKPKHEEYLFMYLGGSKKGWPVTGGRAYREFKRYLKMAELPKSRTLHGMRHERITTWLEKGFNTSEAQYMAGHSSVKVTEGYTHLKGSKLLEKQRDIERNK